MKTMKVELFVQAAKRVYEDNFSIVINACEFQSDEHGIYVTLDKKTIEIEIPELDDKMLTLTQIDQIKDQIKAEKAASYLRVINMEDRINNLMCLENKVED